MEIFALTVGGSFFGVGLFAWFAWGLYRLEKRGPDAPLGKACWQALFWPPAIVCACLLIAKAALVEQRAALPANETAAPASAEQGLYTPAARQAASPKAGQ